MIKLWEVDKEKLIYTLQLNGPIYRFITNKLYFEGFNGTLNPRYILTSDGNHTAFQLISIEYFS